MQRWMFFVLIPVACVFACNKHHENGRISGNCETVKAALTVADEAALIQAVNAYCTDLAPQATAADPGGHSVSLNELVNRLNGPCTLNASLVCYACIKTLPPQSEIRLSLDHNGTLISKVIDISTDPASHLKAIAVHD